MLSGYRFFLILISIVILLIIYMMFIKNRKLSNFDNITYGMLIGGIIGNLIDRIIYGYVIDFLDFTIFGYDYPVFNIADSFIVISIILIVIDSLMKEGKKNVSR